MRPPLLINGLPDSLRTDAWWLGPATPPGPNQPPTSDTGTTHPKRLIALLTILVILADFLFWRRAVGLSVAIFAMVLSICMLASRSERTSPRQWSIALVFELICNLPLFEQLQTLSLMFSAIGLAALMAWISYGRLVSWGRVARAFLHTHTVGMFLLIRDSARQLAVLQNRSDLGRLSAQLILPTVVGALFMGLLTSANPLLSQAAKGLAQIEFGTQDHLLRLMFWGAVASLIWPYLNITSRQITVPPSSEPASRPVIKALVNTASVRNSLVLFNLIFGVQTLMDIAVLSGGYSLPEGMTYAKYAHRGAYPLVATALLAGLFAMATHRLVAHNKSLRALVYLWLWQNLVLVITAAYRLMLYVDVYALTQLRLFAFIWMAIVFVGLVLAIAQIAHQRSNAWLIGSNLALVLGALYLCCFVNFAQVIAGYNLRQTSGETLLDGSYICGLGPQALPKVETWEAASGQLLCTGYHRQWLHPDPILNWREWGFRRWRLQGYLAQEQPG